MKNIFRRTYLLLFTVFSLPLFSGAQKVTVKLATGSQELSAANSESSFRTIKERAGYNGRYYWIARFSTLPSGNEKIQWEKEGFQFQKHLGAQTYLVISTIAPSPDFAAQHRVTQAAPIEPALKISPALNKGRSAAATKDASGRISILVATAPGISPTTIKNSLNQAGFAIENDGLLLQNLISLRVSPGQLMELADFPFIQYIQPIAFDRILNEKARFMSGAFRLNAPLVNGGYNLKGNGVVVGVGDDADPSFHPDLADRIINRTPGIVNSHGAHVSGTIAGAGLLQPDRRGLAPLATIVSQLFSGIWMNAAQYVQDFGMVLTNNSYGAVDGDCEYNGVYDLYSQMLDEEAFALPQLLNVFAAGNSGDDECSPLPQHYNTILGSYQPAKNVITVGRTDYNQLASGSSSSGPVKDGRLKPEITALGIIESTDAFTNYFGAYGTSQSAPSITGGLALLYERYRQLFSGNNPDGALMKCVLLNGARDLGTPGPDYRQGYGYIHLENSIRILNNHKYFGGTMVQGGTRDSVINVPAGTALLKVMLYWHDPAASPLAAKTLMNDLDLEVVRPDGTTIVYPKKLNPSSPESPATEGPDHINNSEQVVIETPQPGNYTIRIKGYEVLSTADQAYYATFDFVPAGVFIRTPVQGDTWSVSAPDEYGIVGVIISWDDEGTPAGTYTLEYSLDNGGTWNTIINNQTDADRYYGWRPPAGTATNQARVRITKNSTAFTNTSGMFSILNRPGYSIAANPCPGYITVNWTAVAGADDYDVIMKQGSQMVSVAIVAPPAFTYTISGLSKDSTYYVAVRARKGGIPGRWIKANPTVPNSGNCAGTISDGDLKLDSIVSPIYGRQFTSTTLGASEDLKVRIKNLDNAIVPAGQFNVKYSIDGSPFISQPGTTPIPSLGTYVHTFSGIDLSVPGAHIVRAVVENTALIDKVTSNDTFSVIIKNLANPPVSLASTFVENFETAPTFTLAKSSIGLPGLDRWDYSNSDQFARARSFVNTGIAKSGTKAITLDVSKAVPFLTKPANNLDGTFNLSNFTTTSDVRLDFDFKHHGSAQVPNAQNKVWVRGSDTDKWVEAYDLSANQPADPGVWKKSTSLELNDLLTAANPAQQFTASMQVRFGQYAEYGMADNTHLAGYTFDDIRLYVAVNDLQLLSIDTPAIYSCGLNSSVPIKVTVRNSTSSPANGVQVSYTINGAAGVTETIPVSIPANGNYVYQFIAEANLSVTGIYIIEATVIFPGDNVPENNNATATINNQPTITSFPYLENFESGPGNYFVTGSNASWEYGMPRSIRIDTAASGIKAWKTRLAGGYNDAEHSQLNSPCFDISGLTNPMLSFSLAYDIEDCTQYGFICDAAWVEYSNDGINWTKLGLSGQGTNWYDNADADIWTKRKQTYWHVATIPLPAGSTNLRLRFVMNSDDATNYEGIAIDDIHIYDRFAPMYTTPGTSNPVNQPVSDPTVNFTDNGKLIATILHNNNYLGNTEVKAYIFNGPVRNNGQQYYGNRNITIKPANFIAGNVTVRFYFSDNEVNDMRLANTCGGCTNPKDYTHLGVTQYTDADKSKEDGDLSNNNNGISTFINGNKLKLVPYDAGYYAEFNVSQFSEFWLNDGKGISQPLPGRWLSFNATKLNNDVVKLTWSTANEVNIRNYEVEVAGSKEAVNAGLFETIGTVNAKNTSQADYTFPDDRKGKAGDYYYRIKQVDSNGKVVYSPVILVQFGLNDFEVKMYPNPVKDNLLVTLQTTDNKKLQLKVYNMASQMLYNQTWLAQSGTSLQTIPFKKLGISKGVYTVAISDGSSWWYGKIVKE
jgi:hypothetical protein